MPPFRYGGTGALCLFEKNDTIAFMTEKVREDKSLLKEPLPQAEEKILSFWKDIDLLNQVKEKSARKKGVFSRPKEFIFYEGPPTANGRPGIHHLVSRAFKDVVLRYKTMRGFNVRRRGGWDTHGLPVELQVEKEIGIKSKKDIEEYGVERFNELCKKSVWNYMEEWERFTDRIGYMLDQKNAYVTYKSDYMESVWNVIAKVAEQGLLYKDYKVVPWCPRCGTALSSHELAQGYQDDKDISVYVKFPIANEPNTYFLAWTTTPWTLPGHVALAVGENIEYIKVKQNNEFYILADSRKSILGEGFEVVQKYSGNELVGIEYEPPFSFLKNNLPDSEKEKLSKAFKVYVADFVNTEDGTGIVHTAVMYGQDDFEFGTKIGLPKVHMVDESGHFVKGTGFLEGRFVKSEETDVEIIKDLAQRNILFKKEKYTHSYPHCWRCQTPLIYYARDSWYIAMSKLRDKLVSENKKIHWEPEYTRDGRFGEWLSDIKDWAISRERYWGTPLPVWESKDGDRLVIDSVDTLKKYTKVSGNKYFVMRHGGTEGNKKALVSYENQEDDHLTEDGKKQVVKSASDLSKEKIDLIFTSPFTRTKETAEIVKTTLGIKEADVIVDERIKEINPGEFDGKDWYAYHEYIYNSGAGWFEKKMEGGGESLGDVKRRVADFLYEIETKYKNKNILIVTHGAPAWLLFVTTGLFLPNPDEYQKVNTHVFVKDFKRFSNGEVRKLDFVPVPHDKNFELDLHKPFIDKVVLVKSSSIGEMKEYKRVKEVLDVWFDSGSVPFAEDHYPFENKKWIEGKGYPADYICEGIDQTRGWFYTMHAIGILLGFGHAFKNVICLGLLLDKEGKKMSKSTGNVVDPWKAMEEFGVDPIRMWMFAVKEPGEPKNFDPESIKDLSRKIFTLLTNVNTFYEMYKVGDEMSDKSSHILDRWVIARFNETNKMVTEGMEGYRIVESARAIRDFISDFSQWYIRRSRERMKDIDSTDAQMASQTTRFVLHSLARIMAPFTPFFAEMLWRDIKTKNDPVSIHLAEWPKFKEVDSEVLSGMSFVRSYVSTALMMRSQRDIKIRQPLQKFTIKHSSEKPKYWKELEEILKDEINVKEIVLDPQAKFDGPAEFDYNITPELKAEGNARELLRNIQDKRKEAGLTPQDSVVVRVSASSLMQAGLGSHLAFIKKQANAKEIVFEERENELEILELTRQ